MGVVGWVLIAIAGQPPVELRYEDSEYYIQRNGWLLAAIAAINAAYFIIFPATNWQATPGKKLFVLRVTDTNGEKIGLIQSAWRYLCQTFVLGIFIPLAMIASTP